MTVEARLAELGITLPDARPASHIFENARQVGNVLYISGQSPKKDGVYPALGHLGADVSLEQGQECARNCVINALSAARGFLGSLERVRSVVKVNGYVSSTPEFTRHPEVMNAASELLIAAFGDAGRHARTSVGVAALPGNIPVEIEMILEIEA